MKALLVADNEKAINNISQVLKTAGYDIIVYRWLLKALDNIEEIAPHLIVISTGDYPRHWKTLAQYATSGFGDYTPQVILYTDENFNEEEQKKAEILKVRGFFDSIGVDGLDKLREILAKKDDIFSGHLTDEDFEQETASVEDLEELIEDEKAADRLEEIAADERAAEKLKNLEETEEIPTVEELMKTPYDEENSVTLPGVDELRKLLESESVLEEEQEIEAEAESEALAESESECEPENESEALAEVESDIEPELESEQESECESVLESEEETECEPESESEIEKEFEDSENDDIIEADGENNMSDEQSIDEKLAAIMNANKADAKEKAEALKLDTEKASAVSFVFTNPVTLAMVSGVARNYNGLVLEFTPDIPSFILNLSPGTKISVASMKIDDKIENVFAEVMSNDAKKLALAIKKIS
ncbi:hypothetical protein [uncultured Treponema sp.]|uniref:hypothetical protein n=1 Tax=uncultured Treponema sp. TaxID=162155 RepID=UPI0025D6DEC8|nr:hypothetical protein [uncultured Treponema sp.]